MEVLNRVSDAPPWSTLLSWSMRRHRISAVRPASRDPRRAVRSAAVLFAVIGVLFGSWASVIPAVSARVQADHAQLGVALLGMAIGALAGMQVGGRWSSRWGPGRAGVTGVALASLAVALPGAAGSLMSLCIALFLFGAAAGGANVAVNALGVELQRSSGRPLMSMLHAGFSFGGLAGALLGGLASGVLPPSVHLALIGGLGLATTYAERGPLVAFAAKANVPDPLPGSGERVVPAFDPRPLVLVLGVAAACTAVAEGAVSDWGSLHLRDTLGSSPSMAAMGFAAFSLAMGSARLAGRPLVIRFGDTPVLVCGAVLGTAGMLIAALAPTPSIALLGFLLAGLGVANVFPLAIARAGLLDGTRGVARASTVGYTGLLGGPPVIGMLAEAWGLRGALVAVAALVMTVAGLAVAVEARLQGGSSVAGALRRQTRARLRALARAGERSLRSHADSLQALVEQTARPTVGGSRPIGDTFPL